MSLIVVSTLPVAMIPCLKLTAVADTLLPKTLVQKIDYKVLEQQEQKKYKAKAEYPDFRLRTVGCCNKRLIRLFAPWRAPRSW